MGGSPLIMRVLVVLFLFAILIIGLTEQRRPKGGKPSKGGKGGKGSSGHGYGKGSSGYGKGKGKGKGKPKPPPKTTTTPVPATTLSGSCNCDTEAIKTAVLAEVTPTITALETELENTNSLLRNISEPHVFSCKRMSGFSDETIPVPYTACDVEKPTGLVDINSGKFTVQRDGTYRLTWTARMSAMNGQTIRADMYVNNVKIGRAIAQLDTFDTQTNTSSTTILDLETSNTLDLLYDLSAGDEVYMMIDYVGTTSLIQSSMNYQIFFTGEWIRS